MAQIGLVLVRRTCSCQDGNPLIVHCQDILLHEGISYFEGKIRMAKYGPGTRYLQHVVEDIHGGCGVLLLRIYQIKHGVVEEPI